MKFPKQFEDKAPMPFYRSFTIPYKKTKLNVLASVEPNGWGHVSVSLFSRNPSWDEMCFIKDLFFDAEEMCIQFHPKKSQYVNVHEHCLHIWQPPKDVSDILNDCIEG